MFLFLSFLLFCTHSSSSLLQNNTPRLLLCLSFICPPCFLFAAASINIVNYSTIIRLLLYSSKITSVENCSPLHMKLEEQSQSLVTECINCILHICHLFIYAIRKHKYIICIHTHLSLFLVFCHYCFLN